MGFAGPFARKGGVWVSGVWCPGLSNLPGRPASAPAASNKARRGQSSRGRPKSAPAHIDVTFAEITCGSGAADAGLPAPDYPQPLAELPGGITASWLTGLLYRTGVLEPASGVIVAHVREITDIYGGTGVVYRLSVVYGGPRQQRMDTAELNIPSSFVLKIYDSDALLPNARRELLFYSSLAHRTPIRTPKCYWSKLRPHCGAQPRCIPDEWPTLEEFLCGPRWCAISEDLLPMDLSGTDSDVDSSSVSESSWGASEAWNPESPRTRPSIATRYVFSHPRPPGESQGWVAAAHRGAGASMLCARGRVPEGVATGAWGPMWVPIAAIRPCIAWPGLRPGDARTCVCAMGAYVRVHSHRLWPEK